MRVSIAQLKAAGLTDTQIVKLLEEREAERREQNRKAQINHRARQHERDLRSDIADTQDFIERKQRARQRDIGESSHIDTSSSSKEEVSIKKERKKSICADWKPTLADLGYAKGKGWSDERIATEAERFRLYYGANGKAWADWHLVWCKWVMSPIQNGGQNGQGRRHGSVLDASDRLGQKLKQLGASDDYVPGSSGPRPLELDKEVRPASSKRLPSR